MSQDYTLCCPAQSDLKEAHFNCAYVYMYLHVYLYIYVK